MKSQIVESFQQLQQTFPQLESWCLAFDFARRRAGACFPTQKRISLSHYHIELNDWPVVKDTLIHEVAHALAWEIYREKGHGKHWQRLVTELGGEAKATGRFNLPRSNWVVVWRNVEQQQMTKVAERFRRNRSIRHWALRGKPESLGQLYYVTQEEYQAWVEQKIEFTEVRFFQ